MESLDNRIDKACWRISTRLSGGGGNGGVMEYLDVHTKLTTLVTFHRDVMKVQGNDEEAVYRALCFAEETMMHPLGDPAREAERLMHALHTLLVLAHPRRGISNDASAFIDDLLAGLHKLRDLSKPDEDGY